MAVLARWLSRGHRFTAGHLSVIRFAVGALVSLAVLSVGGAAWGTARGRRPTPIVAAPAAGKEA